MNIERGIETDQPEFQSRFGDIEKHLKTMAEGEYFMIHGPIDNYLDIEKHANEVNLAEVGYDEFEKLDNITIHEEDISQILPESPAHRNLVELMKIAGEQESILGINKPYSGEKSDIKSDVKRCCVREEIGFWVSDHFAFDFVPPTINRDGGSFQLFMDPNRFLTPKQIKSDMGVDWSVVGEGLDYKKLALFDWLMLVVDRNSSNYLVNLNDHSQLVVIDNGLSLGSDLYRDANMLQGPTSTMTCVRNPDHKDNPKTPENIPIIVSMPQELIEMLKKGRENKEFLDQKLKQAKFERYIEDEETGDLKTVSDRELTDQEIDQFWNRVDLAIETGVFLSRENFEAVTGISRNDPRSQKYF